MKLIAVIGVVGGAGATTTVAHLAGALSLQKRHALSFDFCPTNFLRLHFGMSWADNGGFAASLMQGEDWHAAAYHSAGGLCFVPFGTLENEAALERLTERLNASPQWLKSELAAIQTDDDTIVVCDCPLAPGALRDQVLAAADLVLLICRPDTLGYAEATRIARAAQTEHAPATMIVLNGFDPSRRLDRDIAVLLRTQYKQFFAPVIVHRDEAVREAIACKQMVFEFAPASQAAYDFSALATWTLARLGQQEERS